MSLNLLVDFWLVWQSNKLMNSLYWIQIRSKLASTSFYMLLPNPGKTDNYSKYFSRNFIGQTSCNLEHNIPVSIVAKTTDWYNRVIWGRMYWSILSTFGGMSSIMRSDDNIDQYIWPRTTVFTVQCFFAKNLIFSYVAYKYNYYSNNPLIKIQTYYKKGKKKFH